MYLDTPTAPRFPLYDHFNVGLEGFVGREIEEIAKRIAHFPDFIVKAFDLEPLEDIQLLLVAHREVIGEGLIRV